MLMSSSSSSNEAIKCEHCGITFMTLQDKEEHMKLEHKEGKRPTGVSQLGDRQNRSQEIYMDNLKAGSYPFNADYENTHWEGILI